MDTCLAMNRLVTAHLCANSLPTNNGKRRHGFFAYKWYFRSYLSWRSGNAQDS